MGVLACDRKGCNNIMCDYCVNNRWYICTDCIEDFKGYVAKEAHGETLTEERILELFERFMESYSEPKDYNFNEILDNFFEKHYR
jgi:hypothetical protein